MEGARASIPLVGLLFVLVGVCGECIPNENDNLVTLMFKMQEKLHAQQEEMQEKLHAQQEKMQEKLHAQQEEINKLKNHRSEINDYRQLTFDNGSSIASAITLFLDHISNKLLQSEENEFRSNPERITEKISRLIANAIPYHEKDLSNDTDTIRNLNIKLNEIQAAMATLQTKVEDLVSSDEENEERKLLGNHSNTSPKGLEQVQRMVEGLQEKVHELAVNRENVQLIGTDIESSDGQLNENNNVTYAVRPRYCHDYYIQGERRDGVYRIYPGWNVTRATRVWCEFDVGHEVGWTIILIRMPKENPVNFSLGWDDYKAGIGNADGEYWIGLSTLHEISISHCAQILQVNLQSWDQKTRHAQYKDFSVGDEESGYTLTIGGYTGDAVDAMAYHNGMKFTTQDKDHDSSSGSNCAVTYGGGFWYNKCYHTCPFAPLLKKGDSSAGMRWNKWLNGVNLKKITFKIAPRLPQFV